MNSAISFKKKRIARAMEEISRICMAIPWGFVQIAIKDHVPSKIQLKVEENLTWNGESMVVENRIA